MRANPVPGPAMVPSEATPPRIVQALVADRVTPKAADLALNFDHTVGDPQILRKHARVLDGDGGCAHVNFAKDHTGVGERVVAFAQPDPSANMAAVFDRIVALIPKDLRATLTKVAKGIGA